MADRGVLIQPYVQRHTGPGIDGVRAKLQVVEANNISPYIFRYRQLPLEPLETDRVAVYDGVCTPVDLEEMPIGEPRPNADPPWFRLDYVDLILRSQHLADDWLSVAYEHIANLVNTLNLMDELVADDVVLFGTLGDSSLSDDSSLSLD